VLANPSNASEFVPFVVVLQSDILHGTSAVVVAPLVTDRIVSHSRLTPVFRIDEQDCALVVTDIAAVPRRVFTARIASLASQRDQITAALDFLFFGF
jgi:toxin CcdB